MQLTLELADELLDGRITLANGLSGNGQNLYRGTVLEVYPANDELFTVKYTVDEIAIGDLDKADDANWRASNGVATWSQLRIQCERNSNGVIRFDEPTRTGSTARFDLLIAATRIAA